MANMLRMPLGIIGSTPMLTNAIACFQKHDLAPPTTASNLASTKQPIHEVLNNSTVLPLLVARIFTVRFPNLIQPYPTRLQELYCCAYKAVAPPLPRKDSTNLKLRTFI